MITLATGAPSGRRSRNDSVTPGRAGIVRTSSAAARAEAGRAPPRTSASPSAASRRRGVMVSSMIRPGRFRWQGIGAPVYSPVASAARDPPQCGIPRGTRCKEAVRMATIYDEVYRRAQRDPEGFWAAAAEDVHWERRWDRVLDASRPPYYRWFAGGRLNTCYNALDVHVDRGRGKQLALIHDSPVTQTVCAFTYFELRDQVARFAGALRRLGVETGDRVILYMPMVPEAVIAMLACARIGAVHSVVFGGFASKELATRIDDAKPTVMLSASCGIEGS